MIKRVKAEDVKQMMKSDEEVKILDVLGPESYRKHHLPGAVNVPLESEDFKERVKSEVPNKTTPVVVYCADLECQSSPKAARHLEELGYSDVREFEEGLDGWKKAGYGFEGAESRTGLEAAA